MKKEYNSEDQNPPTQEIVSLQVAQECPTTEKLVDDLIRTLTIKVCLQCKESLCLSKFYYNKTKKSYFSECKECNKARSKKWNKNNKERYRQNCKKHRMSNPDKYKLYKEREYTKNIEKYNKYSKNYRNSAKGKAVRLSLSRKRELAKARACPKWLTKEHIEQMKQFYINRPKGYHVDHIVPLNGQTVCGLHVPWNLQYLPAIDNIKKRNRL